MLSVVILPCEHNFFITSKNKLSRVVTMLQKEKWHYFHILQYSQVNGPTESETTVSIGVSPLRYFLTTKKLLRNSNFLKVNINLVSLRYIHSNVFDIHTKFCCGCWLQRSTWRIGFQQGRRGFRKNQQIDPKLQMSIWRIQFDGLVSNVANQVLEKSTD